MSYEPVFTITPRLLTLVETISSLRERIRGAAIQVAWIPALQKDTRSRNAHSSTAIEGNPLTLEQVRAVETDPEAVTLDASGRRGVGAAPSPTRRFAHAGCVANRAAGKRTRLHLWHHPPR